MAKNDVETFLKKSIFGHFGVILGHFGSFWVILGRFGSFWVVLGRFGSFWVVFGPENYQALLKKASNDPKRTTWPEKWLHTRHYGPQKTSQTRL